MDREDTDSFCVLFYSRGRPDSFATRRCMAATSGGRMLGARTRHPKPVAHEPATAAIQDRRTPRSTCPVLHPAVGRKPAESRVTQRQFSQIIRRIERLAWHPA